ncbi:hypothetical protein HMI55_003782 [Coelomomyces lativittatus]|nr:hypothetical protein HMI55_003782 [Coelomomyces lativittatus]
MASSTNESSSSSSSSSSSPSSSSPSSPSSSSNSNVNSNSNSNSNPNPDTSETIQQPSLLLQDDPSDLTTLSSSAPTPASNFISSYTKRFIRNSIKRTRSISSSHFSSSKFSSSPSLPSSLFSHLNDVFYQLTHHKKKIGVVRPKSFVQKFKDSNGK